MLAHLQAQRSSAEDAGDETAARTITDAIVALKRAREALRPPANVVDLATRRDR